MWKCPAKINLYLKITGKSSNGYHELESLFAFINLFDELLVEKSDNFLLKIIGEFAELVDQKNNLFTQILDYFADEFGISKNLKITIKKNIPVGAGLGGGSSNAAYFMMALNEIFALGLTKISLQKISLKFGSDIAFLLGNQAAIVRGRGEIIQPYKRFLEIPILLINPKITLSTAAVFSKFNGAFSSKLSDVDLLEIDALNLAQNFPNDLQNSAILTLPSISEILSELNFCGAAISKMSGSGASCFGIFKNDSSLDLAAKYFLDKFPNFFVRKSTIISHL
jgi:4-diphosphocytidyl-2-C-methyl-D-erythritol kinase